MIFQETWEAVLAGEKTETRRPVKPWETLHDEKVSTFLVGTYTTTYGRTRYAVGQEYAVQPGRGKKAVGRILVTHIRRQERAEEITTDEARREGFAKIGDFRNAYQRLNGADMLMMPCWVLSFRLVTPVQEEEPHG